MCYFYNKVGQKIWPTFGTDKNLTCVFQVQGKGEKQFTSGSRITFIGFRNLGVK